ncbi:MAG: hypothetical protein ACPHL6_08590 [Rubripirellula sp.]
MNLVLHGMYQIWLKADWQTLILRATGKQADRKDRNGLNSGV